LQSVIVSILAALIATTSLMLVLVLVQRINVLTRQLEEARRALAALDRSATSPVLEQAMAKPLEGLRVMLAVSQDHHHPVFARLLKERLLREDIIAVDEFGGSPADAVDAWSGGRIDADLMIAGGLTCNGYAEVYYHAEFTCYAPTETVCTIVEKPSGGDRPENLAMEIVAQLGGKLDELVHRNERRRAIGELHGN